MRRTSGTTVSGGGRASGGAAAAGPRPSDDKSDDGAESLARRLCVELQALIGNANTFVLLDTLGARLRSGYRDLEAAAVLAVQRGWIERRGDSVALRDEGRRATSTPWPPVDAGPSDAER